MKLLNKHNLPIYIKKYLKAEFNQLKKFYGSELDRQIIFCFPEEVSWLPRFREISIPREYDSFGCVKLLNVEQISKNLSTKYFC